VCRSYPTTESGIFCGEWIMHACERPGVPFHQARLTILANLGLVKKVDNSRGAIAGTTSSETQPWFRRY